MSYRRSIADNVVDHQWSADWTLGPCSPRAMARRGPVGSPANGASASTPREKRLHPPPNALFSRCRGGAPPPIRPPPAPLLRNRPHRLAAPALAERTFDHLLATRTSPRCRRIVLEFEIRLEHRNRSIVIIVARNPEFGKNLAKRDMSRSCGSSHILDMGRNPRRLKNRLKMPHSGEINMLVNLSHHSWFSPVTR